VRSTFCPGTSAATTAIDRIHVDARHHVLLEKSRKYVQDTVKLKHITRVPEKNHQPLFLAKAMVQKHIRSWSTHNMSTLKRGLVQAFKTLVAILQYLQGVLGDDDYHDVQDCVFEYDRYLKKIVHDT